VNNRSNKSPGSFNLIYASGICSEPLKSLNVVKIYRNSPGRGLVKQKEEE